MDIGVYSIKTVPDEKVRQLIERRQSFVLEDIDLLNMPEAIERVEKLIESAGLSCRVYTKGRSATMAMALIPSVTGVVGLAAAAGIGVHNLFTFNPDYEIAKNLVTGTLTVDWKKGPPSEQ